MFLQVTSEDRLYEDRLVGLSVRGKNISNLQEGVNITINLSSEIKVKSLQQQQDQLLVLLHVQQRVLVLQENQTLSCVFLNFASQSEYYPRCM